MMLDIAFEAFLQASKLGMEKAVAKHSGSLKCVTPSVDKAQFCAQTWLNGVNQVTFQLVWLPPSDFVSSTPVEIPSRADLGQVDMTADAKKIAFVAHFYQRESGPSNSEIKVIFEVKLSFTKRFL